MNERTSWTDVQRAAQAFANALELHGFTPTGWTLHVSRGSVTYGHAGELSWAPIEGEPQAPPAVIPGGWRLPRSARDAYDDVVGRTRVVHDLWVVQRSASEGST